VRGMGLSIGIKDGGAPATMPKHSSNYCPPDERSSVPPRSRSARGRRRP
jgi:hypothetical protein